MFKNLYQCVNLGVARTRDCTCVIFYIRKCGVGSNWMIGSIISHFGDLDEGCYYMGLGICGIGVGGILCGGYYRTLC